MNRNLLKTLAAAAMTLLAAACAKEQVAGDGQTVEATFEVDVPGTEVTTKGLSDAAAVDELICQVFLNDGNYTPVPDLNQTVPVTACKAKVSFNLVKGQKYAFIFWAQTHGTGYYNTGDLRSVKMNVDAVKANDPKMDAFWGTDTKTATANASSNKKTLLRALSQVNFGQESLDRSDKLTVTESMVKATGVPDTFHPFAGNTSNACEGSVDITFAKNAAITDEKLTVSGVDYDYLATAYVFAPKTESILSDVSATFTFDNAKTTTVNAPNAPLQGNYRTNILGNLLTVGAEWNITVDPEFKGGDKIYDAVSANLGKGATVTLAEDYSVDSKSKGVTLGLEVTSVLNLNGKKFSNENAVTENKAALQVHGDLTINGDGEVYCAGGATNNAIIVEQGGHLVINGGTYNVGKDKTGISNATIYVTGPDQYGRNGSVEINGGVFMAEAGTDGTSFVLNQSDDITVSCFSVKGGTFVGFNPASVNEAHGAITSFVADGYRSVETTYDGKQAWTVEAIPAVGTQEEFNTALEAAAGQSATIILASNLTVELENNALNNKNANVTIVGDGTQTFDVLSKAVEAESGKLNYQRGSSFTLKNVIVNGENKNYRGVVCDELTLENCVVTGMFTLYSKAKFVNCIFNQDAVEYNMWTYGSDAEYIGCTFNGKGKFLHVYNEGGQGKKTIKVENCTFNNIFSLGKPAINIKGTAGANVLLAFDVNIKNCTVTGTFPATNGGLWQVDNPVSDMSQNQVTVTVDGVTVYPVE